MAKNFVSVASAAELTSVWVSEFEEGAFAYSEAERIHYSLRHNNPISVPVPPNSVFPADGSPGAGSGNPVWVALSA